MEDIPDLSIELCLNGIGMPELVPHFISNKIGVDQFLSLQASHIPIIFPRDTFPIGDALKFVQKYTRFMTSNDFILHPSFKTSDLQDKAMVGTVQPDDTNNNKMAPKISGEVSDDITLEHEEDSSDKDPSYIVTSTASESSSDDSDEGVPLARFLKGPKNHQSTSGLLPNNGKGVEAPSPTRAQTPSISTANDVGSATIEKHPSPLVDRSKVGEKRKRVKTADKEIDELVLREFLDGHTMTKAILMDYATTKDLSECDRSAILDVLVPWLLNLTDNPTKDQYRNLSQKICEVFSLEQASVWYVAPGTEGDTQIYPKGKLPDRVKNSKSKLRKKGFFPAVKSKRPLSLDYVSAPLTNEESASVEWLKRNFEPFSEVRMHWRKCAHARLRDIIFNNDLTPHTYIKNWNGILQLPLAFQLVLDDYEEIPNIDNKYDCLRGTSNNLLLKWTQFSEKILEMVHAKDSGLDKKEKKEFLSLLQAASSENDKDYVILQMLTSFCKQKGRVKVGKVSFKPSVEESKEAFLLHVAVAAEFEKTLKDRLDRHVKYGAPVQPYVCVQGETKSTARAAYVIVNQVPWKASSVLQAVDICFKTCFVLNCGFPPEAMHIWMLLQNYIYGFRFPGDRSIASVTTLIQRLQK